jgi:Bifunctional DNA primase/polymerase, N-terminal/AAA domain/Primase C terminal 1 (PriCT-1)
MDMQRDLIREPNAAYGFDSAKLRCGIEPDSNGWAAIEYARRGWHVFPVIPGGKVPLTTRGLLDASLDEAQIDRWWSMWPNANIGIRTGVVSNLVVLDVDGVDGLASLDYLKQEFGPIDESVLARTGSGGVHIYLQHPGVEVRNSVGRLGPGLDIRGDGGCVVAPPSTHESGGSYKWESVGAVLEPQQVPDWLCQRLATIARGSLAADASVEKVLFREGVRNDTLTSIAGLLRRLGGDAPAIAHCLHVINGQCCEPALPQQEVESIATGIARRYEPETSFLAEAPLAEPIFRTAAELAQMVPEEAEWIAWPLLVGGTVTQLDGEAKRAGKTSLVLAMCRAVIGGEVFLDYQTTRCPVVYLTEQPHAELAVQLSEAQLTHEPDLHLMFWEENVQLSWEATVDAAVKRCQDHGARLLVVDTLGQFAGLGGELENQAGAARDVMNQFAAARSAGIAVLIVRHSRKSGGGIGISAMGSTAFGGAAGILATLRRQEGLPETQRVLETLGRYSTANGKIVVDRQEDGSYTLIGDAATAHGQHVDDLLCALIPLTDDPQEEGLTAKELHALLMEDQTVSASVSKVKDRLKTLCDDETISRETKSGSKGKTFLYYRRS